MSEFDDGLTVWEDRENLRVVVNNPDIGKFEITVFENTYQMSIFVNFGDFEDSNNNDFYVCTGSKLKLKWNALEC